MNTLRLTFSLILLFSLIIFTGMEKEACEAMELTSPDFNNQAEIPKKHTCDGGDISPGLRWADVPDGTRSFVLIVDDPDAPDPVNPKMTWVHWVLYNIPAAAVILPEGDSGNDLPQGTLNGINDWQRIGYGGPCPPIGTHRYFHKLYALDIVLPDLKNPTKNELEKAMDGHIIEKAELVGLYHR